MDPIVSQVIERLKKEMNSPVKSLTLKILRCQQMMFS